MSLEKILDMTKSVYELCREDKEIIPIMKTLGFEQIADASMLNTVGRFMTIQKGAVLKKIAIDDIKKVFEENGYVITYGKDDNNEDR